MTLKQDIQGVIHGLGMIKDMIKNESPKLPDSLESRWMEFSESVANLAATDENIVNSEPVFLSNNVARLKKELQLWWDTLGGINRLEAGVLIGPEREKSAMPLVLGGAAILGLVLLSRRS